MEIAVRYGINMSLRLHSSIGTLTGDAPQFGRREVDPIQRP